MKISLILSILVLPVALTTALDDNNPPCNCQNGGLCVPGPGMDETTTFRSTDDDSSVTFEYHCTCLEGWTGKDCSTPPPVQFCGNDAAGIGHYCFHGGECLMPVILQDLEKLRDQPICDCTKATDNEGNSYTGRHCESVVSVIDKCMSGSYCLNDGTCSLDQHMQPLCTCKDGFEGDLCESFTEGVTQEPQEDDDERRQKLIIISSVMAGVTFLLLVLSCCTDFKRCCGGKGSLRKVEPSSTITPPNEDTPDEKPVVPVTTKHVVAPPAEHFPPPIPDMYDISLEEATFSNGDVASMEKKLAELL